MVALGVHTVTVLRATTTEDDYGNPVRNWGSATQTTVAGCSVQPVQSMGMDPGEVTVNRQTTISRWRLYAPDGTDVQSTDRVRWDGDVYDVDGEPQRWDFPPLSHVTALLRRAF